MAEDFIHHLPQVQLRIPVLLPEFFDTLLNRLQALSLRPMKTLHPCPEAIQAASSRKHSLVFFSLFPFSQTVKQVSLKPGSAGDKIAASEAPVPDDELEEELEQEEEEPVTPGRKQTGQQSSEPS